MKEFDKIMLVWRPGKGERREAVGEIISHPDGHYTFQYLPEAKKLQFTKGFAPYTEFRDFDKIYNSNVVDIFALRLTQSNRLDINKFYKFWEIDSDKIEDKFYLLGKTQGLVSTDNFEFIATYNPTDNIHFVTEVSGLSKNILQGDVLEIGDKLRYELEPNNEYDPQAVKVYKEDIFIGYVKKYHNKIFHETNGILDLEVKAVEKNGTIRRVFLKVCSCDSH